MGKALNWGGLNLALISCPTCGKEVSDKAICCPGCGSELPKAETEEKKNIVICAECGTECDQEQENCPNCGCPLYSKEEMAARRKARSARKKHLIAVVATVALFFVALAGFLVYHFTVSAPREQYNEAMTLLEQGKYSEAEPILSKLGDYKDAETVLDEIKYESIAYACISLWKGALKNPDSFTPYEIKFYGEATEENVMLHPSCVIYYGAQNGFGGNSTGYALFSYEEEKSSYAITGYCNSLDEEDLDEDDDDYFVEMMSQVIINALKESGTEVGSVNMNRLKTVLKNDAYTSIKIIE